MIALTRAWDAQRVADELGATWRVIIDDPPREHAFRPVEWNQEQLQLWFDDAVHPAEGITLADDRHIRALIDFADQWADAAPLVVNCYAGTSRSPAAIMIVLSRLYPGLEAPIVDSIRAAASHIRPNIHMIALGDRLLGAEGRLIEAVTRMRPASTRGFAGRADISTYQFAANFTERWRC